MPSTLQLINQKQPLLKSQDNARGEFVLVIHGGAGTMSKEGSTPEQREAYRAALASALKAGYAVLNEGGEAMDAAVASVTVLEGACLDNSQPKRHLWSKPDNPLFNAAKGAVFNVDGKNELETSIMLSKPPASHPDIPVTRRGLGLTLLTRARNPSKLVRALYLNPTLAPHTFLSGFTAENIGEILGETLVDPSYFFTENRWKEHRRGLGLPEEPFPDQTSPHTREGCLDLFPLDHMPTGTVGAVALDIRGCIATLTSTGGRTNKLVGRIGDTPLMGGGFWAEEWQASSWLSKMFTKFRPRRRYRAVGISGTGDGDFFIRLSTASTIAHRMRFHNQSVKNAAEKAVKDLLRNGGIGGVIALDDRGYVAMPMNCPGMYRGVVRGDGIPKTAIFNDDVLES